MHDPIRHNPEDGQLALQLHDNDGNAWLTQGQIAESFAGRTQNISLPIRTIHASDGKNQRTQLYSLNMLAPPRDARPCGQQPRLAGMGN
ncbi:MAG: hypothetical protein Q8P85_12495 [Pseudomonas sp.]|nr:hypothetical protein [Pseudomonas sp.]